MARAGAAAVLFVLVCCLLVGPAPARRPAELPAQLVPDAVDREASAEPLLPKPLAIVEAADPSTVLSSVQGPEVDLAGQAPQIISCGGEDAAVSEEPLSLGTRAQLAGKGEVQEQERRDDDSDSDSDSDSDDEDNEHGIVAWFWRLARRF
uniref:Antimicrobial peptide Lubelisin-1 transcript 1 n=1 Tax=Bos taurus TaxID=9913 RepID=A0A514Y8L5_BOVIN|nr:antimicrobial peptide Lubelisin-1 transcript 1 [Bos taurus]